LTPFEKNNQVRFRLESGFSETLIKWDHALYMYDRSEPFLRVLAFRFHRIGASPHENSYKVRPPEHPEAHGAMPIATEMN
jgi:hypothetical protein